MKKEIENTDAVHETYPLVGIQGIGKSSTIVYYVLSCIRNGNYRVRYIDMNYVEDEEDLCKLKEYISTMQKGDRLILDHVTVFNGSIVRRIKQLVEHIVSKVLMIETGFSASARHDPKCILDDKWQLDRNEFRKIWMECLRKTKYPLEVQETFIDDLMIIIVVKIILSSHQDCYIEYSVIWCVMKILMIQHGRMGKV